VEERLINIAIPGTPRRLFTYLPAAAYKGRLLPGQRCLVPFGHRKAIGFFIRQTGKKPESKLKPILEVLDHSTLFNTELFDRILTRI
jgi:primosomal protein N' (replication factor Y)